MVRFRFRTESNGKARHGMNDQQCTGPAGRNGPCDSRRRSAECTSSVMGCGGGVCILVLAWQVSPGRARGGALGRLFEESKGDAVQFSSGVMGPAPPTARYNARS